MHTEITSFMPRIERRAAPPAVLRERDAAFYVGLSESQFKREVAAGKLPTPVRLSDRSVGWLVKELDGWLAERAAERIGGTRPYPTGDAA